MADLRATGRPRRTPLRIISLESRRQKELARLVERHGAEVIEAPSMREAPLGDQAKAIAFADTLRAGTCDMLVLLTGVGTTMLMDAMATRHARDALLTALGQVTLVCRGPKPAAVLKTLGLRPSLTVPEPNTWREMLAALDARGEIAGQRVFVQEYGRTNEELLRGLRERGATVQPVPIYAWRLPEDTEPLVRAVEHAIAGTADAVMFTSAQQLEHWLQVAGPQRDALLEALRERLVVASIGPVTSEALARSHIATDVCPEHPKMGPLVRALTQRGPALAAAKRAKPDSTAC